MTGKLVAMLAPEKKATYQVAFLMFPTIVFATKSLSSERDIVIHVIKTTAGTRSRRRCCGRLSVRGSCRA
jgi:hypothetical protein